MCINIHPRLSGHAYVHMCAGVCTVHRNCASLMRVCKRLSLLTSVSPCYNPCEDTPARHLSVALCKTSNSINLTLNTLLQTCANIQHSINIKNRTVTSSHAVSLHSSVTRCVHIKETHSLMNTQVDIANLKKTLLPCAVPLWLSFNIQKRIQ